MYHCCIPPWIAVTNEIYCKEGRKEGRKEERKEGRKEGRKKGRKEGRKEERKKGRKERRKELCGNYLDDWPFRIASFSQCLEIQGCLDSIAHVRVLDRSSQQDRMRIKMSKEAHTERDRQLLYSSAYSQTT
jgi:hypothetical protein